MGTRKARFNRWHFPLKRLLRFLLSLLFRIEVEGLERIPEEGPVIVYINHANWVDPVVAAAVIDREVTVMGKQELFEIPIGGRILREYGVFPVRRDEGDLRAFRQALSILRQGGLLIMAPEGTRSRTGVLQSAKAGMIPLAARVNALVVPVAILGAFNYRENLRRLRHTRVSVVVGEPWQVPADKRKLSHDESQVLVEEAMYRLAALMPPELRGVYGDAGSEATGFGAYRAAGV